MKMIMCGTSRNRGRESVVDRCKAYAVSGKSNRLMYVLPNQYLLNAVREEFLTSPGVHGIVEDSFVLFEGLYRIIARRLRIRKRQIGEVGRLIAMKNTVSRLANQGELEIFHSLVTSQGFLQDMLDLISAFKRAIIQPGDLRDALHEQNVEPRDKDILKIYETYQNELKNANVIDKEDLPLLVLDSLVSSQNVQETLEGLDVLVFDGFFDFTPVEKAVIRELRRYVEDVFICFDVDTRRVELFDPVISLANSLEGFSVQYFERTDEVMQTALDHVRWNIFSAETSKVASDDSIFVNCYPSIYREVREAARTAKELIQRGEYSIQDICFAVRDVHMYQSAFAQVFAEFGLPTRLVSHQRLSQTCVGRAVLSMLAIARDWSCSDVVQLLKTGYIDFGGTIDVDILEQIIVRSGIRRGRRSWEEKLDRFVFSLKGSYGIAMADAEQDVLEKMREEIILVESACNKLKDFLSALDCFGSIGTLADYASTLIKCLEEFGFERSIKDYANSPYTAMNHYELESYFRIMEILREVKTADRLFQSTELTIGDFADMMKQLLREASLGGTPIPCNDITVLSVTELRLLEFPVVFLLGLGEGIFPASVREDWIYPDMERDRLAWLGIDLETAKRRRNKERLFFYAVVSCAKERLYISYPEKGVSDTGLPSQYLDELLDLFEDDAVKANMSQSWSLPPCDLDRFSSQNELVLSLVNSFWSSRTEELPEVDRALALYGFAATLNQDLLMRISYLVDVEAMRDGFHFSGWDGHITDRFLIDDLRERLENKIYSITELEAYAQCPFMYYASRVLRLKEVTEEEHELSNLDRGEIYHQILKEFFELNKGKILSREMSEVYRETLITVTDRVFSEIESRAPLLHKGFLDIEKRVVFRDLSQLIENEIYINESTDTHLYPTYFEVGFGLRTSRQDRNEVSLREPLVMQGDDQVVRLWGKIDRIDLDACGRFLVYDYKKSKVHSFVDIQEGRALQIAVYLMAANELLFQGKHECLGGAYYAINSFDKNVGLWKKRYSDITGISSRTNSNMEDSEFEQTMESVREYIREYVKSIGNGKFVVRPSSKCPPFCQFKRICRYDKWRIQKKKYPDFYDHAVGAAESAGALESGVGAE